MSNQYHPVKMIPIAVLLLITLLGGCGPDEQASVEEQIRQYLYHNQPLDGDKFVAWANSELNGHSSREVYRALTSVGQTQAELGHPNAVAALSFAAQAWAESKSLKYQPAEWKTIQQVAIDNLQNGRQSELNLWP